MEYTKKTEEKEEQLCGKNRYLWLPLMVSGQFNRVKETERMTQSINERGSVHVRSLCDLDRKQLAITCPLHQYGSSKALSLHTAESLNSTLFITAINTNRLYTLAPHHSCPQRPLTIQDFKRTLPQSDRVI